MCAKCAKCSNLHIPTQIILTKHDYSIEREADIYMLLHKHTLWRKQKKYEKKILQLFWLVYCTRNVVDTFYE